jgi:serine/threonine-protein kinase
MGVVYKARDPKIGREVAIKTIRLSDKVDPSEVNTLRERLFREAQSAGRLSHPGIVTIYDIEEEGDLAYISMEFVDGQTVDRLMNSGDVRAHTFTAAVIRQAGAALDYAHSRDIIHRDVKPANLMVTRDERLKITDFGIARVSSSQLTQTGTVMGTPSYMSPEQVKGDPINGRSDQFSLAVIAYEMLTGQKPFAGENLTSVMFKIVSEAPVEPKVHNPAIPLRVQEALLKALSKNPAERYPACASFAAALAAELEGTQAAYSIPATAEKAEQEETPTTGELDQTAPLQRREDSREDLSKTTPVNAPASLPPLSSPRNWGADTSTSGAAPFGRRKKRASGWIWVLGPLAALAMAALALGVLNPTLMDDPAGWIRATISPGNLHARMTSSVQLLLERNRWPVPPREITDPIEQAARRQRDLAPEQTAPEPAANRPEPEVEPAAASSGAAAAAELPSEASGAAVTPPPRAARVVAVNFRTATPGAQVVVDRDPRWSCTSPCSLELPRGRHVAVASLAGYRSYPKVFEADSGVADVQIQMSQITGTLLISSEPSGAEVFIDGQRISGATNLQQDVPPGYHTIRVAKAGAGSGERSVRVQEAGLHTVHFVLGEERGQTGHLVITSNPAGAEIVVNDRQRAGTTPREMELAPGKYRVAVSRPGYRPVIREIELAAGQRQTFEAVLTPLN